MVGKASYRKSAPHSSSFAEESIRIEVTSNYWNMNRMGTIYTRVRDIGVPILKVSCNETKVCISSGLQRFVCGKGVVDGK